MEINFPTSSSTITEIHQRRCSDNKHPAYELSELAQQSLKDPYVFDFLTMTKPFQERGVEQQLISHITKFLLELGKGLHLLVSSTI
ncbi:putative nuclease of restriction endonuclease-like (RecB) superfamily [Pedobacter sp. UYEF25]